MDKKLILLFALLVLFCFGFRRRDMNYSVTLSPVYDTYLDETQPTVNVGLSPNFVVFGLESVERVSLLRFDMDMLVGKKIQQATLYLYNATPMPSDGAFMFYRVLNNPWNEVEATWSHAVVPVLLWTGEEGCRESGVDYASEEMGVFYPSGQSVNSELQIALDVGEIEQMIADNYGVVIKSTSEYFSAFRSSEYSNSAYRPKLVVVYSD